MELESTISILSTPDLVGEIEQLVDSENGTTVRVLNRLNELEKRRGYVELGYFSLFDFCTRKLKFSEPAACRRIQAARTIAAFPSVRTLLLERSVNLTTISIFGPKLTEENQSLILEGVSGKGKTEARRFIATLFPEPSKPREEITFFALALAKEKQEWNKELFALGLKQLEDGRVVRLEPGDEPAQVDLLHQFSFCLSDTALESFNRVRAIMGRGRFQDVSLEETFETVLTEYLQRHDPVERQKRRDERRQRKLAAVLNAGPQEKLSLSKSQMAKPAPETVSKLEMLPSPAELQAPEATDPVVEIPVADSEASRKTSPSAQGRSRAISARVRDEVLIRDGYSCSFVAPDGTSCCNKVNLQLDHYGVPFASGGAHTSENLKLMCRAHNFLRAENVFGKDFMARYRRS